MNEESTGVSLPDSIEVSTMEQLLQNICLLLSSRTREVVKAALGFIKVILFIMDPKALGSHAATMVRTLHQSAGYLTWKPFETIKSVFLQF